MGNASALAGLLLLMGVVSASPAHAQTATVDGAYQRLSPGNAKVAMALFEAQVPPPVPAPTGSGARATAAKTTPPRTLTLDQIAVMRQSGQGWGQVFQSLKTQGLVRDRDLGQAVSRHEHQQHVVSGGVLTTAAK